MVRKKDINTDIESLRYQISLGVAVISGIFCAVLSIFLIIGYLQIKTADPINSPALEKLIVEANNNPLNQELREAVRELDLISRNAFFTKQAQFRTGGYLLLVGAVLFFISLKFVTIYRKRAPVTPGCTGVDNYFFITSVARKYIAWGGITVLILAIVIALTARTELPSSLSDITRKDPATDVTLLPAQERLPDVLPVMGVSNWPAFRGYGGNAMVLEYEDVPITWDGKTGDGIVWKTAIPRPGFNSPIVWGNKVFLSGADSDIREVYCFDTEKGEMLWKKVVSGIPGSPSEVPEVTADTGYAAATMATDGQRVFSIFANGDLVAFTMEGEKVWGRNLGMPDNHYGHSSSLITYKNLLIVQYDHNESTHLMALDVTSGRTVWDIDRDTTISWSSPIVVYNESRDEVIVESSTGVYSYAPDSGKLYWAQECLSGEVAPSPVYADGVIYVANDNAAVVAIDSNGQIIWSVDDVDLPDVASPLVVGNKLLLFSSFGVITCMARESGKVVWIHENNDGMGFYSSPILVGDRVYAVDMSGVMHIFTVEPEFKEIAAPSLGESVVATPAFVGGRIYMRSNKWLYCIGFKVKG